MRIHGHMAKESKLVRIADNAVMSAVDGWANGASERHGKSHYDPKQANHAQTDEAFEHGGNHIFFAHHTAIEKRQAGGH